MTPPGVDSVTSSRLCEINTLEQGSILNEKSGLHPTGWCQVETRTRTTQVTPIFSQLSLRAISAMSVAEPASFRVVKVRGGVTDCWHQKRCQSFKSADKLSRKVGESRIIFSAFIWRTIFNMTNTCILHDSYEYDPCVESRVTVWATISSLSWRMESYMKLQWQIVLFVWSDWKNYKTLWMF